MMTKNKTVNPYPLTCTGMQSREEVPRKTPSFIAYVVSTGCVSLLLTGLSTITGVLTARILGPTGRGQMALAMQVLGMSSIIGELGLGFATVYYTKKYSLGKLASATLALTCLASLLIVPLAAGAVYLFRESIFSNVPPWLLTLAIVFIPVSLARVRLEGLLQAGYRIHLAANVELTGLLRLMWNSAGP